MSGGEIRATKMSGAGNDFIVLTADEFARVAGDPVEWVRRVCRRRISLGADGVLVVERLEQRSVAVTFYNPDGSPAFCGNGSRCAARFAALHGLAPDRMLLETSIGPVPAEVRGAEVRLELPPPEDRGMLRIELPDGTVEGRWIVAGVPHFVVVSATDVDGWPLETRGPRLRRHPSFGAEGTNVDVLARLPDGKLALRTWERGVEGETLACGSGAVAAAAAARIESGDTSRFTILHASGIPVVVELEGPVSRPARVTLTGDARRIFEGALSDEATEST